MLKAVVVHTYVVLPCYKNFTKVIISLLYVGLGTRILNYFLGLDRQEPEGLRTVLDAVI